jgi:hypothetical protein
MLTGSISESRPPSPGIRRHILGHGRLGRLHRNPRGSAATQAVPLELDFLSFYRSTCEARKHEDFLYLGKAGFYAAATDPHPLLAEWIESPVSPEHAKCVSSQEEGQKAPKGIP